jgi:enoyl-CoA hydratase/carnithine racemase
MGVEKPVVCAVNGICAGAGFHFVGDADFSVASSDATFTEPHVSVGQVSALEPISLLPHMPFGEVMRLVLMGRHTRMTAARAAEVGLVTQVIDPPERLRDEVQTIAETIASNSTAASILSKRAVWNALEMGRQASLDVGMEILMSFWGHPDNVEGARAFAEKRAPSWTESSVE